MFSSLVSDRLVHKVELVCFCCCCCCCCCVFAACMPRAGMGNGNDAMMQWADRMETKERES